MFYRASFSPDWKTALPSYTDNVESVDIPVHEQRHYYVTSHDGQGFYLTRCHHSITVVKSVKTKATGVYHHFFIPFRDSRDKYPDSYQGELYRGFHNNGFREDFTGLEIYADKQGRIIKTLRYYRGKVYAGLYAGDGKGTQQRIQWQLNYYIAKAYGIKDHAHTKADGHYACPNCGAILEIGEDGYYCCPSCSWTEMDFWEQELDEVTIYGEGGSNGNNPDPFPDPENPNQPDPNTGGDEGGGGNNGSSPDNPTDSIPGNYTFDTNAVNYILPTLLIINSDCAGNALINAISGVAIPFTENIQLGDMVAVRTPQNIYDVISRIDYYLCGPVRPSILFEELFHCWQIINDNYRPAFALNVEVEAKYAAYVYALHTGTTDNLFIPPTCSTRWWDAFASYYNEPSSYNYSRMIDSVRVSSPRYNEMIDNPQHHEMINLSNLFDCY